MLSTSCRPWVCCCRLEPGEAAAIRTRWAAQKRATAVGASTLLLLLAVLALLGALVARWALPEELAAVLPATLLRRS